MQGACPTWREKRRAGIPNMMDVKLRKPQMARVMMERMRKLFGGGYWLGIVAPRGAVTSGCTGACMGVGWELSLFFANMSKCRRARDDFIKGIRTSGTA